MAAMMIQEEAVAAVHWVGADVAKKTFDVGLVQEGQHFPETPLRDIPAETFPRTPAPASILNRRRDAGRSKGGGGTQTTWGGPVVAAATRTICKDYTFFGIDDVDELDPRDTETAPSPSSPFNLFPSLALDYCKKTGPRAQVPFTWRRGTQCCRPRSGTRHGGLLNGSSLQNRTSYRPETRASSPNRGPLDRPRAARLLCSSRTHTSRDTTQTRSRSYRSSRCQTDCPPSTRSRSGSRSLRRTNPPATCRDNPSSPTGSP